MLTNELLQQAAGLMGAADATQSPSLRSRLVMAAKIMIEAAGYIQKQKWKEEDIPQFLKKQA